MFGLYTEKRVRKLVARLTAEHSEALAERQAVLDSLKVENRALKVRVLELEGERSSVAEALITAAKESEHLKETRAAEMENGEREIRLLAEKCRALAESLERRYPDEEEIAEFSAFVGELERALGKEVAEEETGFNMDDVIAPKEPLDLGKLCRDLGLMEEEL